MIHHRIAAVLLSLTLPLPLWAQQVESPWICTPTEGHISGDATCEFAVVIGPESGYPLRWDDMPDSGVLYDELRVVPPRARSDRRPPVAGMLIDFAWYLPKPGSDSSAKHVRLSLVEHGGEWHLRIVASAAEPDADLDLPPLLLPLGQYDGEGVRIRIEPGFTAAPLAVEHVIQVIAKDSVVATQLELPGDIAYTRVLGAIATANLPTPTTMHISFTPHNEIPQSMAEGVSSAGPRQ